MKKEKVKLNNQSDRFTVTEVGTLLESMDQKINLIAESQVSTDRRLANVETELHGVNRRLDMVELGVDVVSGKVTRMEDGLLKLTKDLKETRTELKGDIHNLRTELKGDIQNLRTELKEDIRNLGDRLTAIEPRR